MNSEKQNFNKITQFITDSYNTLPNKGVVVVKSVRNGFMVNNMLVKQDDSYWVVQREKVEIAKFKQRRVAILYAALTSKKRYYDSNKMTGIDRQLDVFLEDKNNFMIRLKKSDNPVLSSRLSRTENDLELLDQQLRELEKSLSLQ